MATSSERSLGTRPTTNSYGTILIGALFRNTSALPLAVGNVEYNAELWFTQATANNLDGYQFFYQIGTSPITSLNPFTVNNTATFAANASVDDVGWNRVATLDYSDSNATASLALATPIVKNIKAPLNVTLQPNLSGCGADVRIPPNHAAGSDTATRQRWPAATLVAVAVG